MAQELRTLRPLSAAKIAPNPESVLCWEPVDLTISRGLSGPPSTKPHKSPEKSLLGASSAAAPRESGKKSFRKSFRDLFDTLPDFLETFSRLSGAQKAEGPRDPCK